MQGLIVRQFCAAAMLFMSTGIVLGQSNCPNCQSMPATTACACSGCQCGCQRCNGRALPGRGRLRHCLCPCSDVCPHFAPGASVRAFMGAQIENGMVNRLALYNYDFYNHGPHQGLLTNRGKRQVEQIARHLPYIAAPIYVQTTDDTVVDEIRRQSVIDELAQEGVQISSLQVITGYPTLPSTDGEEARLIYQSMISPDASTGAGDGASATSAAGFAPIFTGSGQR